MYELIKNLRPYFYSLREIETNVSLDIKLPITWDFEKTITLYSSVKYKVQDKNDKFNLLSLISVANEDGYNLLFVCANDIIRVNKEEEEKQKLFQLKLRELKELFDKENLDNLKHLNLNLHTNGQGVEIRDETFGKGIQEELIGDREPQEKSDRRTKASRQKQNV